MIGYQMQYLRLSCARICLCLLGLLAPSLSAASAGDSEGTQVLGWVEKAIVMPVGATVKAKLDSGALTSSMHATAIELRDRGDMIYPVLIGRRTLRDLGLVDVNATYLTQPSCESGEDAEATAA